MNDRKLGNEFDALRESDRQSAPGFETIWSRVKSAEEIDVSDTPPTTWWIPLAASVIIGALLLFGTMRQQPLSPKQPGITPSITTWQSPTDELLRTTGQTMPAPASIFSSVLDGVAPVSRSRELE
ncbi:MAG TPA: hypothetical protein VF105_06630 [Gemmatimonadaceae bacterium]